MKKTFLFLMIILVLIIVISVINISNNNAKITNIAKFNKQFEEYKNKTLYGADVVTLINKAIDNNDSYNIDKDENGYYIDNNTYAIKINLILLSTDEDGNINEIEYPMETLQKAGLSGFISNFSTTKFECIEIEYNSYGRASNVLVKQLEI